MNKIKMIKSDIKVEMQKKCDLEEALECVGFGKYSLIMLISCCMLILALMLDIFGMSVALPSVACDLGLTINQQGLLSAIPLMGVTISSYVWGLCSDTMGRRKTLLFTMPISIILNLAFSFAPSFPSMTVIKFFAASFTSSSNAAGLVLLGESVSPKHRKQCMFLLAATSMSSQLWAALIALPISAMSFKIPITWLNFNYRPWRLLFILISLPGIIGTLGIIILKESPKFLLSKGRHDEALKVMRNMYRWNSGLSESNFPIEALVLDESIKVNNESSKSSFLVTIWNQTAPLFRPPLLKNSLMVYYLLMCAYMTTTGYSMWIPSITNAYYNGNDASGKTLCEVASIAARPINSTETDCDHLMLPFTLYAVMVYSAAPTILAFLVMLLVKPLGTKGTTLLIFVCSIASGVVVLFIRIPLLSIMFFYLFLYVVVILGNANTYLVELNPTHLRSMAACLSVVMCRGFSFISVQVIATFLSNHCHYLITGYILLVASGFVVSWFLPSDKELEEAQKNKNIK